MAEIYEEFSFGLEAPVGLFGATLRTPGFTVQEGLATSALEPSVTLRQPNVDATSPLTRGWSYSEGVYLSTSGVADLNFDVQAFGQQFKGGRHVVGNPETGLLTYAGYLVSGDGSGPLSTHIDGTLADTDNLRILLSAQIAYGSELHTLLGGKARQTDADLSFLPVAQRDGDVLAVQNGIVSMAVPLHPA